MILYIGQRFIVNKGISVLLPIAKWHLPIRQASIATIFMQNRRNPRRITVSLREIHCKLAFQTPRRMQTEAIGKISRLQQRELINFVQGEIVEEFWGDLKEFEEDQGRR
ncbi:uncharacterized protein LOC143174331 [Nomia melanderi]|uniref:uncharacterized protein LOC143174331 n=1 Tax=Nomia melanderi TaxID=2448451 RepID=UPI003FCE837C